MIFLWPDLLWLLLLVPVLVALYILLQRRRTKYALRYASLSLVRDALGRGPGVRRHVPPVLFFIGVIVLLFALSRPAAVLMLPSQEGTVILAMDISGSMLAEDLIPTRLDAAKEAARAFIEKQPPDVKVGVVAFSGVASLVQPPTKNREAVQATIDRLKPQEATALGLGILTSLDAVFEDTGGILELNPDDPLGLLVPAPASPTVPAGSYASAFVILLTDGESNSGPAPLDVIENAASRGVRIYTVGVGSPEGTTLKLAGRYARVELDEATLRNIAETTGGQYFRADNAAELRNIYETLSTRTVYVREQTELTAAFTGAGIVILLLAGTLSILWFNRLP